MIVYEVSIFKKNMSILKIYPRTRLKMDLKIHVHYIFVHSHINVIIESINNFYNSTKSYVFTIVYIIPPRLL